MKENSDGNDTNVGSIGNSIEEDIKILESIIKINNDYLKGIENQTINQKEIKAIEHILSDYKRVLKENEIYKKNSEIMSKENLSTAEQLKVEIKENFRLKNQLENNRKEYQETYKDVREELKELKKENEILKKEKEQAWEEWNNLEQGSYGTEQKLKQQIKKLQEENEKLIYARNWYFEHTVNKICTPEMLDKILRNDYISKQKLKDKIRKNEEIIDISNDGDLIHELLQKNKVYEELLESEEK